MLNYVLYNYNRRPFTHISISAPVSSDPVIAEEEEDDDDDEDDVLVNYTDVLSDDESEAELLDEVLIKKLSYMVRLYILTDSSATVLSQPYHR